MPASQPPQIEVYQGNSTLRRLMAASLKEAGFEVTARRTIGRPGDKKDDQAPADLLVVDVDSDLGDLSGLVGRFKDAARPILTCGVSASREFHGSGPWLTRPFSQEQFLAQCMALLGLNTLPRLLEDAIPDSPPDSASEVNEDSLGDTQRLSSDDVERLEEQLGLTKGQLGAGLDEISLPSDDFIHQVTDASLKTLELSARTGLLNIRSLTQPPQTRSPQIQPSQGADPEPGTAVEPIAEIDTSEIEELDPDLLESTSAGLAARVAHGAPAIVVGEVTRRRLSRVELSDETLEANFVAAPGPFGPRGAPAVTMPELPAIKRRAIEGLKEAGAEEKAGEQDREFERAEADANDEIAPRARPTEPMPRVQDTPTRPPSSYTSSIQLAPAIEQRVAGVAELLGDAWALIGRLARAADRSAQIRRILRAAVSDGVDAAASEVHRIPAVPGFSGNLAAMSVADLLRTISERGLRGRLELSIDGHDFALFINGGKIDEIENLSGNEDRALLDALLKMRNLSHAQHAELLQSLDDQLAAPIRVRLRGAGRAASQSGGLPTPPMVPGPALHQARRTCAVQLFEKIRQLESRALPAGDFAFMRILPDGGHAWPTDALGLQVDELLSADLSDNPLEDATLSLTRRPGDLSSDA